MGSLFVEKLSSAVRKALIDDMLSRSTDGVSILADAAKSVTEALEARVILKAMKGFDYISRVYSFRVSFKSLKDCVFLTSHILLPFLNLLRCSRRPMSTCVFLPTRQSMMWVRKSLHLSVQSIHSCMIVSSSGVWVVSFFMIVLQEPIHHPAVPRYVVSCPYVLPKT